MIKFFIAFALVIIAIFIIETFLIKKERKGYQYIRKNFFMSKAEREFFDILINSFGDRFYIFAQVHLSTLFDHKIKGQSWLGAFTKINQKSVDFVLCEKNYISPKLAIELDDRSHEKSDRVERDELVEKIFENANFPLLRIKNSERNNYIEIINKINTLILK